MLTRLAPAVERPEIHLGVWSSGEQLHVWGATRAIPSHCFVLEDIEPGLLVIKHRRRDSLGKYANVAVLKGEQVKVIDEKGTSLPDCPELLKSLLAFTASASNGASQRSLNVLVQLAVSMRAHNHGGILLVIPTRSKLGRFDCATGSVLRRSARFALTELLRNEPDKDNQRETHKQWEGIVRRAVDTIAGLTAVDGATIINDRI